jgi:gliding motility-associated-like protein
MWDKTIGWEGWEDLNGLEILDDGILLAGSSSSVVTLGRTAINDYSQNYLVVKLDFSGNIVWKKMYGGPALERLWKIIPTRDGGFLMGGYSISETGYEKTQAGRGGGDAWLVKTDGDGNVEWDRTYGGDTLEEAFALRQLPNGDFLVGCTTYSGQSGDKTEASRGDMDFWIIRIDEKGNKIWDKTIGGDYYDQINDIELAPDGNVYISGGTRSKPNTGEVSGDTERGNVDFWLIKMNPDTRQILWNHRFGGTSYDFPYGLCVAGDGTVWMGGPSQSKEAPPTASNNGKSAPFMGGTFDGWVVQVSPNGSKIRDVAFGGSGHDEIYFVKEDIGESGRILLSGFSSSPVSGNKTEASRGSYDYWLQGITPGGEKKWEMVAGGSNQDVMYYSAQLPDGSYILAGTSLSPKSGEKSEDLFVSGMADFWVLRTACNLSVSADPKQISLPCAAVPVSMTAIPKGSCTGCSYEWSTGDTTATIGIQPGFNDTVFLTVRDRYSCFARDTIPVQIGPSPEVSLGVKDTLLLFGQTLSLGVPNPQLRYLWNTGDTAAVISIKSKGVYSVTATNQFGCTASAEVMVRQQEVPSWWAPNAFSPNDDGRHDYFNIWFNERDVKRVITFQIADRWGSILYKRDDFLPDNDLRTGGWDGTHRGRPADIGVYIWIAQIEYNDGKKEAASGTINLLK